MTEQNKRKTTPYTKLFDHIFEGLPSSIKMADKGYFADILIHARRENRDGFLLKNQLHSIAIEGSFYSWRQSLTRLENAGLITKTEGGWTVDWDGQTTSAQRDAKRDQNRLDQQRKRERDIERKALHDADDHSKCYLPYCDKATRWARGKKPKTAPGQTLTSGSDLSNIRSEEASLTEKISSPSVQRDAAARRTDRAGALPPPLASQDHQHERTDDKRTRQSVDWKWTTAGTKVAKEYADGTIEIMED